MPLDVTPLALPAYEQAYVAELYDRLKPAALEAYRQYFLTRTIPRWQVQMTAYVDVTGATDPLLPAYEKSYVRESYLYLRSDAERAYVDYILERTPWYWQAEMSLVAYVKSPLPLFNWREAIINDGGTISPARITVLQTFVEAEKTSGTWQLVDDYWLLAGENATQSLISFKRGARCTAVAAPTFTANVGYTFNGTTQYLDTGFVPASNAVALTDNSLRAAVWECTDVTSNTIAFGSQHNSTRSLRVLPRNGLNMVGNAQSANGTFTLPVATSIGYTSVSRDGPLVTDLKAYKNGVAMVRTIDPSGLATNLPTVSMYIGAGNNNSGAIQAARACQVAFACVGAALTPAQETAQYNNVVALLSQSGAITDADAQLWATQVVTNGGAAVGAAQLARVSALIAQMKAAGTWTSLDDAWLLVSETSQQALTSLKQRRLGVAVGSPVFTAGLGYAFNGTTNYIDTGFIPATHGTLSSGDNRRIAAYERVHYIGAFDNIGGQNVPTFSDRLRVLQNASGFVAGAFGFNIASFANSGSLDSRGLTSFSRTPAGVFEFFRRGVSIGVVSPASPTTNRSTVSLYIGGANVNGVLTAPRAATMAWASYGASLTAAQELASYDAVQSYMTAWGAQV